MPRYKSSERDTARGETQALLLEAAIVEFAQQGYAGANVNQISKAAGFAKGTIYNYFESKRALMHALIELIAAQHFQFIREIVLQVESPTQRLEKFWEAGFAFVQNYLPQARVMVNNVYGADPEFKNAMYQAYLPMFEFVGKEILGPGVAQGIFRPLDPIQTANLLMNIYLGAASQVNEHGKPWFEASQVADFVLNGLHK